LEKSFLRLLAGSILLLSGVAFADLQSLSLPDTGWNVWLDKEAKWKDEPVYFPGEAPLSAIASRPPTPGWGALSKNGEAVVTLPTTVEQHFWGTDGLRPYKNEYFYEDRDKAPRNGNYLGVSWWWHNIEVPRYFGGKTAILHIRAAKQRAEVYVNRQLVGYQLIGETSFDCDVSKALRPGETNTIAIRITNPGGRLDWGDWSSTSLGGKGFFGGHAFGGLDRGITLSAHEPVRITDAWVLNTPDPIMIFPHVRVESAPGQALKGTVSLAVIDPATHAVVAVGKIPVAQGPSGSYTFSTKLTIPHAKLWSPSHPNLYTLKFSYDGEVAETRNVTFGCRWFGPEGVGSHALLRLNGQRMRVFSAISWGFWGINGLWPTPALAEKEVRVAKSLGLNSLNFHRNIPRTEALDAADRLGLLRYAEPGGGMTLFWNKGSDEDSFQHYMTEKILAMVRDHRSHPSLTMYVVQNELGEDEYKRPIAEKILRAIHAEDPSRAAVLKSGIPTKGEMWPLTTTPYTSIKGTAIQAGQTSIRWEPQIRGTTITTRARPSTCIATRTKKRLSTTAKWEGAAPPTTTP
jgi:beta-galactosidase/beta-glucuronidase